MLLLSLQLVLLALLADIVCGQGSSDTMSESGMTTTLSWTSPNATATENSSSGNSSATSTGKYPTSTDDSCGATAGRMCLTSGIRPCCSSGGFCGGTAEYCGSGCQSEFGSCSAPNETLGNPACSWADLGTSPRCDGHCGAKWNNSICNPDAGPGDFVKYGVFDYGPCCSSEGYCGSTTAHCGTGCQSGCNDSDSAASSSADATVTVTATAAGSSGTATGMANHMVAASSGGTFALVLSFVGALLVI
ncbi:Carbohydrate esterase family 4 protein [Neofusicoccum parvum]|uniref:Carbohydrate esterase family 4 protein n=1 Tax=Neofusicoccum parvum TaxID=310453 RepID=A0ACB5S8V1_9PEZI|nr:Carbohydrate esterase family 4 protein [Neofusicoccum parvum]